MNVKDDYGETPLHCAVWNNHLDIVSLLVEKGADRDVKNAKEKTALDMVTKHHNPDIMSVLSK